MTFAVNTHDSWGIVQVGRYPSLAEARKVFSLICDDPLVQERWNGEGGGVGSSR